MGPRFSSKVGTSLAFSIFSWALNFLSDLSSGLDPHIVLSVELLIINCVMILLINNNNNNNNSSFLWRRMQSGEIDS